MLDNLDPAKALGKIQALLCCILGSKGCEFEPHPPICPSWRYSMPSMELLYRWSLYSELKVKILKSRL